MIKQGILISLGEMFLKSKTVKDIFQRRLVNNLCFFFDKEKIEYKALSFRERIFIETDDKRAKNIVKRVFGISWFSQCFYLSDIKQLFSFVNNNCKDWVKEKETFALRIKISDGAMKESKEEIIDKVAQNINRKVDLSNPDKEICIEIRREGIFVYFDKKKGSKGLPAGSSGKTLVLISGGIDSPVAAYLTAKRGAENIFIHFHSFPLVSNSSIEKIEDIAKVLSKYQSKIKIYLVPFSKAQIEIKTKSLPQYRILLYRRLMFKIAEIIAQKENCKALVTGESLGQVSSQTLDNIKITGETVKIPILRPLIGMDKEEIIKIAGKIGTFKISIKPQEDCCTLFVSKHQTGQGKIEVIKEMEKKLKIEKIIKEIVKGIEIKEIA